MRLQKQFSFQSNQQYQDLASLAHKHDYRSVSAFVQAIAIGQISLGRVTLSKLEQQTILTAVLALTERAELKAARTLASFALDNLLLEEELTKQLDDAASAIASPWIERIEEYIDRQQPFGLSYQDGAGRVWSYNVRFAQVIWREKRNYLECWCEETEGNRDLEELQHNWTLRLDRIIDAAIVPLEGDWHDGLDCIDVEFQLLDGFAHAYARRSSDITTNWQSIEPPIKQVQRRISNTFWFVREMLTYGKDCVVVVPEPVRDRMIDEHKAAIGNYQHSR
ncbi:helix-turn-helix transcriptional regulator [Aliterella atlantica]|uniref:helix-turn-helix transcriptional regulator n=1 Tax=Aliterella atlantica TaxID=1827278 RepID=UPI0005D3F42C|nr:WYL domain-containing protein [Aliterella atlantica]